MTIHRNKAKPSESTKLFMANFEKRLKSVKKSKKCRFFQKESCFDPDYHKCKEATCLGCFGPHSSLGLREGPPFAAQGLISLALRESDHMSRPLA